MGNTCKSSKNGQVVETTQKDMSHSTDMTQLVGLKGTSNPVQFPLREKIILNHDTRIFRFSLPSKSHTLGLPIGNHIAINAKLQNEKGEDENIIRAYTPVSTENDKGYFDLLIKVYHQNTHEKFPKGGKMTSNVIENLKIGEEITIIGPNGRIEYVAPGEFSIKANKKQVPPSGNAPYPSLNSKLNYTKKVTKIGMIAAGSGITPMLQIIKQVLNDENDNTELYLLFANRTEKDILCKQELDDFAENPKYKGQLKVNYILSQPETDEWKEDPGKLTGRIGFDVFMKTLPKYASICGGNSQGDDTLMCICGPPPMIEEVAVPGLKKMGYEDEDIFVY